MDLSPLPILDAAENYRGAFIDLDAARVVSGDALRTGQALLARRLRDRGVMSGDRVVVAISNGPEFVAALVAVLKVGGSPILLHARTPAPELRRTALRYGAPHLLTNTSSVDELAQESIAGEPLAVDDWLQLVAGKVDAKSEGFDSQYCQLPGVPLHPTSGTTGQPKIAVRPGPAAVAEATNYIEAIGITADDTVVAVAPMCHAYAYGMCVMVPLVSGARVVSLRNFQATQVIEALTDHRATVLPAVPAMFDLLLFTAGSRLRTDVRSVFSAGSPLPERTAARFSAKSGVTIRPLYGTTETGGIAVSPAGGEQIAGSCVGPAMRRVEAQVRAAAEQTDWQPGVGKLFVRSPSMMAGYLGKDGIDTSAVSDGWFSTGDLARIDDAQRIHLLGREAEVINVEGLKVIPCEVEEVIATLPGVHDVKVYGGRRHNGGQFIKAAIVADAEVHASTIRAHCERNLVYYKRPTRIFHLERLPRSAAGKILRDQLP